MARGRKSKRSLLGFLAAAILALSVQAGTAATAHADHCWQQTEIQRWCNYAGEHIGAGVGRWFNAPNDGTNLRPWLRNDVSDAYGGTVHKCVGFKGEWWLNPNEWCGWGTFGVDLPGYHPKGWIFVRNLANGARVLYGGGKHWIPNA